jgi:hypothetical protein
VSGVWPPLAAADAEARAAGLFRIAALLGSRASANALARELGRIRAQLRERPAPLEDARAAHAIVAWLEKETP